ncbi:protein Shroom1 isoform 1-T2 [Pholidichthys leucotaenia]
MDSCNFHFERMSNVDLHPVSLPISRLSPAKSNSSIVEQLAHHQHGKGDSAYSSFSGGSTVPDYPSPFLPDDLQSSSFSHYADLKYVKSLYNPTQSLQSDSKTMDQLYRSVEAISQQYLNNSKQHTHDGSYSANVSNKTLSKQEVPSSQIAPVHPPPVPTRLDSFIATKNLENSQFLHQETELQPQLQQQPKPNNWLHPQLQRPEHAKPSIDISNLNCENADLVWRGSQQKQAQPQQPPSYRPQLQTYDQARVQLYPEYLSVMNNAKQISPPRGSIQPEHLLPKKFSNSSGYADDHLNNLNSQSESQRKRAHSAQEGFGSESRRAASSRNSGLISSSNIQHRRQFYFVTGVCKPSESGMRTHSLSVCGSEAGSEFSTVLETHRLTESERCHSTMENLFVPLQKGSRSSSGTIPDQREAFSSADPNSNEDQKDHRPPHILTQSFQSFDALQEIDTMQNREIGRHTASNPIFYCGPDRHCPPHSNTQSVEATSHISSEQLNHNTRDDREKRGRLHPLEDVASERINKETTPLLYHLTGANRAALQLKKDPVFSIKSKDTVLIKTGEGDVVLSGNERSPQGGISKNDRVETACNTLDDSFKKYYKEKLKDVQSKVLRETSFKRRDLQLSLPQRVKQKPELRPTAIHCFSSSQDSEASTDTLTPSVTSEETEKGSIKEEVIEEKHTEHENVRPSNVAQHQMARIGGRKRLTAEQKKMCYSEPEKLNQLGGAPSHSACHSFGSESDNVFAAEFVGEERVAQGEQGLVAARRKIFEKRGRALSASSDSKTNLKHVQHQALVEYMERKTGQKVAEPQQPTAQLLPPPRQRHSLGEKPFDWGPRPLPGNHEGKTMKKNFHRPQSAGRILDSSTSSMRYAQFFSAQSYSGQYADHHNQSRWRESHGPSQGKSASAESLLDQPEPPCFLRNRSTSTPHAFQAHGFENDPLPANATETLRSQENAIEETLVNSAPEGQKPVRVIAQRGKSMEELGASKLTKVSALSKSSEQLDQLWRYSAGSSEGQHKRSVPNFTEIKEARGQERRRKKLNVLEQKGKESNITGQKNSQGELLNQTQQKSLLKQNSESGEDEIVGTRNSSRSTSPSSSSHAKLQPVSPSSHSPVQDEFRSSSVHSETSSNPPSPSGSEISEKEMKSILPFPTQTKLPCENGLSSRVRTSPSVVESDQEQLVNESSLDSTHEVSLSCGVTTDPSLWILPDEIKEDAKSPLLTDSINDKPTSPVPPKQTSETSLSPCSSISDADTNQQEEEENVPEVEDENVGENQEMEARGTPEGETESLQRPIDKPQWEELVEAVVKADHSLARVLFPVTNRKTALMLMEQLLSEDTLLMEEHYKKKQEQKDAAESSEMVEGSQPSPSPASDSLTSQGTDLQSKADITEKKRLLVSCIEDHLRSLEEAHCALQLEIQENTTRGEALQVLVREHCLPVELERYNLFIGDLERVVSLLLCLSARLARVQNALSTVDQHTDAEEKQSLDSRHLLLCKQREDAKDLKDNLDRRENLVSTFLSRQLSTEQLQDYRRFVQTKASLLIRQKDLEEKQRLREEQLEALSNSLYL